MPKKISPEKIKKVRDSYGENPDSLGQSLGLMLLDNNIPIEAAAIILAVTKPTIYRWMYGEASPRDADKIKKIKLFMTILRRAGRDKNFPLVGNVKTRMKLAIEMVQKYRASAIKN